MKQSDFSVLKVFYEELQTKNPFLTLSILDIVKIAQNQKRKYEKILSSDVPACVFLALTEMIAQNGNKSFSCHINNEFSKLQKFEKSEIIPIVIPKPERKTTKEVIRFMSQEKNQTIRQIASELKISKSKVGRIVDEIQQTAN